MPCAFFYLSFSVVDHLLGLGWCSPGKRFASFVTVTCGTILLAFIRFTAATASAKLIFGVGHASTLFTLDFICSTVLVIVVLASRASASVSAIRTDSSDVLIIFTSLSVISFVIAPVGSLLFAAQEAC